MAKSLGLSQWIGLVILELSLIALRLQVTGGQDAVPDVGELVAASILVQVWVEHVWPNLLAFHNGLA